MEDVDACDLSDIRYAVNATLHDNEASFAFDEKCKEQGITVIHAVNLGKAAFLAVEKPNGYPFSEVMKRGTFSLSQMSRTELARVMPWREKVPCNGTDDFRCSLGKYISQYGMFWQMPVPCEANRHYSEKSFPQLGIGACIAAGYCANILANLTEGKEVKYFPKFYLSPLLEEI